MIKIQGKKNDLGGGMIVQRILPQQPKRMVGPFCFLDHLGPLTTAPNQNIDVRPHPHIGLSTLTYLFEGRIVHRDSLGCESSIVPGEVNWMTAGRGISHSERAHKEDRGAARRLHGLQFWVALPDGKEDIDPSFRHYEAKEIPFHENEERRITLVAGEAFGLSSPVETSSPLVFLEIMAKTNFTMSPPDPAGFELAAYMVHGSGEISGEKIGTNELLTWNKGTQPQIQVREGSRLVVMGGEPFSTPRHIWWNLVSSSRDKIEAAKKLWREGAFPMVPGETEFIPLPE